MTLTVRIEVPVQNPKGCLQISRDGMETVELKPGVRWQGYIWKGSDITLKEVECE